MSIQLIHGDCLEVMPTLPANSVQMVFADLPYNITSAHWDCKIDLAILLPMLTRAGSESFLSLFTAVQPFASKLIASRPSMFRQELIWNRKRPSGFYNASKRVLSCHENILLFGNPGGTYNPQKIAGKNTNVTTKYSGGVLHGGARPCSGRVSSMRHPTSVLCVDERDLRQDTLNGNTLRRLHPTQKPVALLEWLIKTYTNEGDTVLDPTAGSGTTAIAALRTGRNAICIEKDKGYYDVMCKRVAEERRQMEFAV